MSFGVPAEGHALLLLTACLKVGLQQRAQYHNDCPAKVQLNADRQHAQKVR